MPVALAGFVVCFRTLDSTDKFARHYMPTARKIEFKRELNSYIATDEDGTFLGQFEADFVAAILPIETVGPAANAQN